MLVCLYWIIRRGVYVWGVFWNFSAKWTNFKVTRLGMWFCWLEWLINQIISMFKHLISSFLMFMIVFQTISCLFLIITTIFIILVCLITIQQYSFIIFCCVVQLYSVVEFITKLYLSEKLIAIFITFFAVIFYEL